jgi:hypothetical protein
VLFGHYANNADGLNDIPLAGIAGKSVTGRLPRSQLHWDEASRFLSWSDSRWYYSRLQGARGRSRSALTAARSDALEGANAYERRFTQGATIVPRNFFFVDIAQRLDPGDSVRDRVLSLVTSPAADAEAKAPWRGTLMRGRAEGELLYRTAISKNVLPFLLVNPPIVMLPVMIAGSGKSRAFKVLNSEELLAAGYRYASAWFTDAEEHWNKKRTARNAAAEMSLTKYLNWQSKLSGQNPRAKYIVLYTSSATDASAVVVDPQEWDHPFVVDHKTYWCETQSAHEAHYLAAFINSRYANDLIKDFQSRGLFGPRDIHKTIVKVPFPKFDRTNETHMALAVLGQTCAGKVARVVGSDPKDLGARSLGRLRSHIRERLDADLEKIDKLVEELSGTHSAAAIGARKRRRRRSTTGQLFDL